ncbi:MAG TPA: ribonuclease HII [Nitrospiraceae bacterium]|jgi:ribonuclease HII|nr:ribonuclease HII [Nitrospiraceae bacterium]HAS54284.1 ribonuclease HII [Nitrospiraceae bacterium]
MPRGISPSGGHRSGRTRDMVGGLFDPLSYEQDAWKQGFRLIAGLDEAGRGPLAGPVVAAAVILPEGLLIPGVTDSKALSPKQRDRLYDVISEKAIASAVGMADVETIDRVNIYQATIIAMERAVEALIAAPDYLLIDALALPRVPLPQKPIIKGDCLSHSIAAASIIAKVTRDRLMQELHEQYPQYNFKKHKGYGTAEHLELLRTHGPCAAHRRSFEPVARLCAGSMQ